MTQDDRHIEQMKKQVTELLLDVLRSTLQKVQDDYTLLAGSGPSAPVAASGDTEDGISPPPPIPSEVENAPTAGQGQVQLPLNFPEPPDDELTDYPVREEGERDAAFRQRVVQANRERQREKSIDRRAEQEVPLEPVFSEDAITDFEGRQRQVARRVPDPPPPPDDGYDEDEEKERQYPTGRPKYPVEANQRRTSDAMDDVFRSLNTFLAVLAESVVDNRSRVIDMETDFMHSVGG